MRMIDIKVTALALGIALSAAASAQASAQESPRPADPSNIPGYCDRVRVAIPPELTGWSVTTPVTAGSSMRRAPAIEIGHGVAATLRPSSGIGWAAKPGKDAAKTGDGGLFAFTVAREGRYRVALGGGAWVDVVRGGRALTSVAHAHGPQCTGIRKMVDFDLKPGRHYLQIAGAKDAGLTLLVARLSH